MPGILAPQVNVQVDKPKTPTPIEQAGVPLQEFNAAMDTLVGTLASQENADIPVPSTLPEDKVEEYSPVPATDNSGLSPFAKGFLDAVSSAEGTGMGYDIIVGGGKFTDYSAHPNVVGFVGKEGPSTAAGKYQITKQTWDEYSKKLSLTDFSPVNQDKAAYALAQARYKKNTKGRDLELDLAYGNYNYLRSALQDTWTGIRISKDFEQQISRNVSSRNTTEIRPVGFTMIRYNNTGAIRNKPVTSELEGKLDTAISSVLGIGYTAEIYSGGQEGDRRTGSIRHNADAEGKGLAADVRIYNPKGEQITNKETLDKLKDFWIQNNYGSVGTYMKGMGMHLDVWTADKLKPGMGLTWSY